MELERLTQPPYNTTMMGVVHGALRYHGIEVDAPGIYGLSGHAFLINIHKELCPSGPYCWNREAASGLVRNLGLAFVDLGFFDPKSTPAQRAAVDDRLRAALDTGLPCALINLENQLITGYDDGGFRTCQPWAPHVDFPPARLSFGSWKEFGDAFHANFYVLEKVPPADHLRAVLNSLDYAVDLYARPGWHTSGDYGIGPEAYGRWIAAAAQFGGSHGNWWNGTVWSECRQMAAEYLADIGRKYPAVAGQAARLSSTYAGIAAALSRASDKELEAEAKIEALTTAKGQEAEAIGQVAALAAALREGGRP